MHFCGTAVMKVMVLVPIGWSYNLYTWWMETLSPTIQSDSSCHSVHRLVLYIPGGWRHYHPPFKVIVLATLYLGWYYNIPGGWRHYHPPFKVIVLATLYLGWYYNIPGGWRHYHPPLYSWVQEGRGFSSLCQLTY